MRCFASLTTFSSSALTPVVVRNSAMKSPYQQLAYPGSSTSWRSRRVEGKDERHRRILPPHSLFCRPDGAALLPSPPLVFQARHRACVGAPATTLVFPA